MVKIRQNSPFRLNFLLKLAFFTTILIQKAYSVFRIGLPQTSGLSDWPGQSVVNSHYNKLVDKFLIMSSKNQFKIFSDRNRGGP